MVNTMSLSEARIVFKAGKNRDGYVSSDDLIKQVSHAIDIFETKTNAFFGQKEHPARGSGHFQIERGLSQVPE